MRQWLEVQTSSNEYGEKHVQTRPTHAKRLNIVYKLNSALANSSRLISRVSDSQEQRLFAIHFLLAAAAAFMHVLI
jgi:hypothetical protein